MTQKNLISLVFLCFVTCLFHTPTTAQSATVTRQKNSTVHKTAQLKTWHEYSKRKPYHAKSNREYGLDPEYGPVLESMTANVTPKRASVKSKSRTLRKTPAKRVKATPVAKNIKPAVAETQTNTSPQAPAKAQQPTQTSTAKDPQTQPAKQVSKAEHPPIHVLHSPAPQRPASGELVLRTPDNTPEAIKADLSDNSHLQDQVTKVREPEPTPYVGQAKHEVLKNELRLPDPDYTTL